MRSWILAIGISLFFFLVPLQCFIIGDSMGAGIQGAVYRFQVTTTGESVIPVTAEFFYVSGGLITGKTAVSILLWVAGTIVLAIAAIGSLILWTAVSEQQYLILVKVAGAAGLLYAASIVTQYGFILAGPAGRSLPVGLVLLFLFLGSMVYYRQTILEQSG